MTQANQEIASLMERLREGPQKAMLHVKKIIEKFRKQTEEDIEIATTTELQQWCGQAAELQVLKADKENRVIRRPRFSKLNKTNAEAVQGNFKARLRLPR